MSKLDTIRNLALMPLETAYVLVVIGIAVIGIAVRRPARLEFLQLWSPLPLATGRAGAALFGMLLMQLGLRRFNDEFGWVASNWVTIALWGTVVAVPVALVCDLLQMTMADAADDQRETTESIRAARTRRKRLSRREREQRKDRRATQRR